DSDTKSSAGDKYETSRAMMQIEQAQNEQQLSNLISLKENLNLIKFRNAYEKVELGSLILSDADHFFLTQALGSFQIEGQKFHCLSLASPLGQKLHHKKIGEVISLGNKSFTIKNIL
ncbi:MAG: hypothetical protein KDC82_00335, partial [Bacteroidetes bacterium]|nr:hypothetical protein [Bacteroidota bacterium]